MTPSTVWRPRGSSTWTAPGVGGQTGTRPPSPQQRRRCAVRSGQQRKKGLQQRISCVQQRKGCARKL
jgi:hypothetical protein